MNCSLMSGLENASIKKFLSPNVLTRLKWNVCLQEPPHVKLGIKLFGTFDLFLGLTVIYYHVDN